MRNKKAIFLLILGSVFLISGVLVSIHPKENKLNDQGFTSDTKSSHKDYSVLGEQGQVVSKSPHFAKTEVKVTKVFDGDTVETETGEKIRYLGINASEKGEPFSKEATELNRQLVLGKSIGIEYDIQKKDRFGRTLAYVFVGNVSISEELVRKGLAVSETIQPNVKYQDKIVDAQKEARDNCLGIWASLCKEEKPETFDGLSSCIKIVSIHADASGNDNQNKNGEWVEIKNSCSKLVSLDKWVLKDSSSSNKYQFNNLSLDSEKNVFLYSGCGQDSFDKLYWQCPEGKYAIWNNTGDHAFLYNEKGELVSDYQY